MARIAPQALVKIGHNRHSEPFQHHLSSLKRWPSNPPTASHICSCLWHWSGFRHQVCILWGINNLGNFACKPVSGFGYLTLLHWFWCSSVIHLFWWMYILCVPERGVGCGRNAGLLQGVVGNYVFGCGDSVFEDNLQTDCRWQRQNHHIYQVSLGKFVLDVDYYGLSLSNKKFSTRKISIT